MQKAPTVKLGLLTKPKLGGFPCKHERGLNSIKWTVCRDPIPVTLRLYPRACLST